jgi:pimeloyl-ACP methyl ester carboxylesterase
MREVIKVPQTQIDFMRSLPVWAALESRAATVPPETQAVMEYQFDATRFSHLEVPTLLLIGSESPADIFHGVNRELKQALPRSALVELAGQQHGAMFTAPDLFVSTVGEFVAKHSRP